VSARCPLAGQPSHSRAWLDLYSAVVLAKRPPCSSHDTAGAHGGGGGTASQLDAAAAAGLEGGGLGVVQAGDTVLFETYPAFLTDWGESQHFVLARRVDGSAPPRHSLVKDKVRRVVAGLTFVSVVVLVAMGEVSLLVGMLVASYFLVAIQCCTIQQAFNSIKGRVVLAAIAAFGLGEGLTNTGVTAAVATGMVRVGQPLGSTMLLVFIYLSTAGLSCLVSNQATVVIMYSIVKHLDVAGLTMHKLSVVLIIGASSPFVSAVVSRAWHMSRGATSALVLELVGRLTA
jgi:hypothetical protein